MTDIPPEAIGLSGAVALGLLSAALSVLAYAPYLRDTLRGRTQPHRACWFIWSVLAAIAFFSLRHEGAGLGLWFVGSQAACTSLIFLMSISHGQGRWITRTDGLVLCLAGLGLLAWALTDSAVYALGLSIAISLAGGLLTVGKAFHSPDTETLPTWVISWLAAGAALAATPAAGGIWNPILAAYPLYLFTMNGAIVLAVLSGRRHAARSHPSSRPPGRHDRRRAWTMARVLRAGHLLGRGTRGAHGSRGRHGNAMCLHEARSRATRAYLWRDMPWM